MKFEQLLMQRSEEQHKRLALEEEVKKLQVELEGEETVRTVLEHALDGSSSMPSHPRHSVPLPAPVKALVSELEMIEDEILGLERKVEELRLEMNEERAQVRELERRSQKQNKLQRSLLRDDQWRSMSRKYDVSRVGGESRRASDSRSLASSNRDMSELSRSRVGGAKFGKVKANELSEELIKCVIGIFVELKRTHVDKEGSSSTRKLTSLSSMSSKGFSGKTPFSNAKSPTFVFNLNSHSKMDPYAILFPNLDCIMRDVGPYKNFLQLTTLSLDITRFRDCLTGIAKLRVLMSKLCDVDLTFLTYKQKLAFWINIYNACIMHAFLEHGLPSSGEKLLALMNKASLNVGGIVLNALAIEHFILRCPTESNNAPAYDKEMLLRHAHGLGYPEPNVTFALCRGTWSSPALRVYTAENVADEMERAKVEYLEASISVTSKRKVVVPKLLQWHMSDFADDLGSLVEWIYSQLARSGSLKRLLMECLDEEAKLPVNEMVEVQPYDSEFRYLLST